MRKNLTLKNILLKNKVITVMLFCISSGFIAHGWADNKTGNAQHMGVATCATSTCHGSANFHENSTIGRNEYYLWSTEDKHSKAFAALLTEHGQRIARNLNLGDASKAGECLACHSDYVAQPLRGERFSLSDGVGCETCHGPAQHWLKSHYRQGVTHADNVANGMTPLDNAVKRGSLCATCHVGNRDRFAGHAMMGAGHPRLRFELDTYLAIQPAHFVVDEDYSKRKTAIAPINQWILGQFQTALQNTTNIQQRLLGPNQLYPEWALFDCFSCHRSISDVVQKNENFSKTPGELRLNVTAIKMVDLISSALAITNGKQPLDDELWQIHVNLQRNPKAVLSTVDKLKADIETLRGKVPNKLNKSQRQQLLRYLLTKADISSYLSAEQAVMAVEILLIDLQPNADLGRLLKPALAKIQVPETYSATQLRAELNRLAKRLDL